MARRCTCSRLVAAVEGDPRLRTLPLAVRMLFLLVAEAASRAPVVGLLPFTDPRRVSLLVSASETEVETGLETLVAEGLLRRQDGGIGVPLLLDMPARAEVARRNGAAGGRPRKGETADAARERRQRELLLPMGPAKPRETEASKPAVVPNTTESLQSISGGDARARDWVSLGVEVADIAGMDGARGGFDYRPVQAWLNEGATPDQVLAAVRAVVGQPHYVAGRVHSLKYFDRAVAAARLAGARPVVVRDSESDAAVVAAAEARIAAALGRVAA